MLQMTTFLADNWDQFVLPRPAVQQGQSEAPDTFPVDGRQYFANTNGANYALPGCYTCHRGYTIPQASVNITELDTLDPDARIVAFPPTLTGLVDTVEQPTE
jgi:photosynthetic reaction center cytochrome c subunit